MKKLMIALASMVMTIMFATSANAGSDSPTPYTVNHLGILLPDGKTFEDNGHVNLQTVGFHKDMHFESKCIDRTDAECKGDLHNFAQFIGKDFIPWSAFGMEVETCVKWVQISNFEEHYGEGGQPPVCYVIPKEIVDPEWNISDPTCESPGIVTLIPGEGFTWGPLIKDTALATVTDPQTVFAGNKETTYLVEGLTVEPIKTGEECEPVVEPTPTPEPTVTPTAPVETDQPPITDTPMPDPKTGIGDPISEDVVVPKSGELPNAGGPPALTIIGGFLLLICGVTAVLLSRNKS